MRVTDIRIAAHGGTSLSKNMGRACRGEKIIWKELFFFFFNHIYISYLQNHKVTSIANAFPINSVHSKRCWFFTTGNILAESKKLKHITHNLASFSTVYVKLELGESTQPPNKKIKKNICKLKSYSKKAVPDKLLIVLKV